MRLWYIIVECVAVIKFEMDDGSGNGTGGFKIKVYTDEYSGIHECDNSKILIVPIVGKRK